MEIDKLRERFSQSEAKLSMERRLRAIRFKLPSPMRERFAVARFDYANRRLVGDGCALLDNGSVCEL